MKMKKVRKLVAGMFCITFFSLGSVTVKGEELFSVSEIVQENKKQQSFQQEEEKELFTSGEKDEISVK